MTCFLKKKTVQFLAWTTNSARTASRKKQLDDALNKQFVASQSYYAEGNKGNLNVENNKRKNASDGRTLKKRA